MEERKGPKEGAPEQAMQGFLRGAGLTSLDEAELRDTPKGKVWFAVKHVTGQRNRRRPAANFARHHPGLYLAQIAALGADNLPLGAALASHCGRAGWASFGRHAGYGRGESDCLWR